jgi:hypothetical protein
MSNRIQRILTAVLTSVVLVLFALPAHVSPAEPAPAPWAMLAWDAEVGRIIGNESDSEGPKSFAVRPDGGVLILDQVNHRILDLRSDGSLAGRLPLPSSTFDDVASFEGGMVLALDRLVTKTLLVMDAGGSILAEVPVEGRGIEHAGLVTALLPRPDGVWLEVQHRYSVKVLNRQLRSCTRSIVLGRPIVNGLSLIGKLERGGATLSIRGRGSDTSEHSVTLTAQAPIRRIVWLDADAKGHVHAVLHEVQRSDASPYQVLLERYWMIELDERLHEIRRTQSPWPLTLYDQRVEFRLGPGGLWQMAFTPKGVRVIDWGRRTP